MLPSDHLLVASDQGVALVAPDGSSRALTSAPAVTAYDDGAGGVVLQDALPPGDDPPSAAVMWLPPDGGDAVTVIPEGLAGIVRVQDAGLVDGTPTALFTVTEGGGSPETAQESLQAIALPDGERRRVTLTGGWESGTNSASLGGNLIVLDQFSLATTEFDVVDLSGAQVTIAANPLSQEGCFDNAACPSRLAIDPSGERVAWLQGDDVELVVQGIDATEREVVVDLTRAQLAAPFHATGLQLHANAFTLLASPSSPTLHRWNVTVLRPTEHSGSIG